MNFIKIEQKLNILSLICVAVSMEIFIFIIIYFIRLVKVIDIIRIIITIIGITIRKIISI